MKQVDYQVKDVSCINGGDISPSHSSFSSNDHLTIGNLIFEVNPCSSISQEEYYNSVLIAKQNVLPISCIQERKKQGIIESFYSYKRLNSNQNNKQNEIIQKIMNMNTSQQSILQNYLQLFSSSQGQRFLQENSDSGSISRRCSFSSNQDIETKESAYSFFIERELGNFFNNSGVNGKSQVFQYTVIQCIENELEPYIQRKGVSEAYINLLGSNRNHYQQMVMRIGIYEAHQANIRQSNNISLLRSHIQCYDQAKLAQNQEGFSENIQRQSKLGILNVSPLTNSIQSSIETFEKCKLDCSIASTIIPCIFNGQLLGFIQLECFSILPEIVKKLLNDRKINKFSIPNFWNESEYNIKGEVFLQKMESYNH